jgi:hypothetical protein
MQHKLKYSFIHPFTHSFTHSLIHSFIPSFTALTSLSIREGPLLLVNRNKPSWPSSQDSFKRFAFAQAKTVSRPRETVLRAWKACFEGQDGLFLLTRRRGPSLMEREVSAVNEGMNE